MAATHVVPEWFSAIGTKRNYNTMVYYAGTGGNTFEINFVGGYISQSDVKAFMINDSTRENVPMAVTFVNTNTVNTYHNVPVGWTVCIYRDTPKARPLAKFVDGAVINAYNLDRNAQQAVFSVAEMVDRFDSTTESVELALKEVYEANMKSEQAIATANAATAKADGAVNSANGAVATANNASAKADTAINTANAATAAAAGATSTANDAKAIAQGIDGKATQAINTANEAKGIAEGIDAKATQALSTSNTANQNASTALNTANGIDGKATQAITTANAANAKADQALGSIGTVTELSDRVKSFGANSQVDWKGIHVFPGMAATGTLWQDSVPNGTNKQDFQSMEVSGVNYIRLMRANKNAASVNEIMEPDGLVLNSGGNWMMKSYTNGNMSIRNDFGVRNINANGYLRTLAAEGAGSWNGQLNAQAPFNMDWGNTTNSAAYFPMIKSYRQNSKGYPTAVSFGHLAADSSWGTAAIHVIGDGGKSASYTFNVDGMLYVPGYVKTGAVDCDGNITVKGSIVANKDISTSSNMWASSGGFFVNGGSLQAGGRINGTAYNGYLDDWMRQNFIGWVNLGVQEWTGPGGTGGRNIIAPAGQVATGITADGAGNVGGLFHRGFWVNYHNGTKKLIDQL